MSKQVVDILLAFCYLVLIALVAGCVSYFLMKQQARKLRTVFVRAGDAFKFRKKFVKPVRVALVSDFHIPKMPPDKNAVLNAIVKNSPDCVVIAGDLCENEKYIGETVGFVKNIAAECTCPVIIVLGNHDILDACGADSEKIKNYRKNLESAGENVTTLVDEKYVFECVGTDRKILFGGLQDYRYTSGEKIAGLARQWHYEAKNSSTDVVLISHNPDAAFHVEENCYPDVLLSGHTHAGQMWMPFNAEFRFLRKDILPRDGYKYGLYSYKGRFPMYITSGVGCSFLPIRFKSVAEVAIIDL